MSYMFNNLVRVPNLSPIEQYKLLNNVAHDENPARLELSIKRNMSLFHFICPVKREMMIY